MTDYLKQAKSTIQMAYHAGQDAGPLLAIAEALIALVERLDKLTNVNSANDTSWLRVDDGRP